MIRITPNVMACSGLWDHNLRNRFVILPTSLGSMLDEILSFTNQILSGSKESLCKTARQVCTACEFLRTRGNLRLRMRSHPPLLFKTADIVPRQLVLDCGRQQPDMRLDQSEELIFQKGPTRQKA